MNVEIARRALRGGFRAGFALGCGAVTIDVFYAVVSTVLVTPLIRTRAVQLGVGIPGVILLGYLGIGSLLAARTHLRGDPLASGPPLGSTHAGYLTGLLMTLLNPMTLAFWFVAVPGRVALFKEDARHNLPIICVGVFVGTLGWVICFAGLLGWAGRYRRNWWMAVADGIGGVVLLGFALVAVWRLAVIAGIGPTSN